MLYLLLCSHYVISLPGGSVSTADSSSNDTLPLRLVNGTSPLEGRVEVFYNNQWGTVCGQGANYYVARVICWQLGYADALSLKKHSEFGEGAGPVWIKPSCYGDETSLKQCRVGASLAIHCEKRFGHTRDLGVVCTGISCRNMSSYTLNIVLSMIITK